MASFTDSPQVYLPQGAPLVDPNQYDASLGYKDTQYNEGVRRVQNAYDTIAGIDVIRGVDKDYLQTKLSDLRDNIQKMAGGDYSNTSVVTQAAALAPHIIKDTNVQNAVMSTQQIRSLMSSQKTVKAKDPGAYGPEAEWWDNRSVNDYLSNSELGALYNGSTTATKLKNFDPELQTKLKEIVPEKSVVLNSDGKYQWKKETYESVTNDKIQAVIDGYFATNPDAYQAAKIKGMYTYRNYDALAMATTIQKSYQDNIAALEEINGKYDVDITNNGKNGDFVNDRIRAKTANMQSIAAMQKKINHYEKDKNGNSVYVPGEYIQNLADPSKLDDMKATLFNDNYKAMYGKILQKDNVTDRSIVENHNAVHADENYWKSMDYRIKAGEFNLHVNETKYKAAEAGYKWDSNGNLVALTPQDGAMYDVYMSHVKGKKADGTASGDGHDYGTPYIGGTLNKGGTVDEKQIDANIQAASSIAAGERERYKGLWTKAKGKTDADFEKYMINQNTLYNSTDPKDQADDDYVAYRQTILKPTVDLQSNLKMKQDAISDANKNNPITAIDQTVVLRDANGNAKVNLVISPTRHAEFMTDFNDLYSDVEKEAMRRQAISQKDSKGRPIHVAPGAEEKRQIANELLATKYKNSGVYGQMKDIVSSQNGMGDVYSKILLPYRDVLGNRKAAENSYYAKNAKNFAPQESPYGDKEADMNDVKNKVYGILSTSGFKGVTGKDFSNVPVADIHVVGNSVDPVTDNAIYHVQGKDSKGNTLDDYVVNNSPSSASVDKIPTYNPYQWVNRVIEVNGSTPLTGDGVLASFDGKLKFQIVKGPYGLSYGVVNGGSLMGGRRCSDAADAFNNINRLMMEPSLMGGKKSAEEAMYQFTHTYPEYKAKYQQPSN